MASGDQKVQGPAGHAQLAAGNKYDTSRSDAFWYRPKIDAVRWNKSYPYQLLVVRQKVEDGGKVTYYQDDQANKFVFTLPFTPSSIQETWPFAIEGGATQGGFVEQRNGSPVRPITFAGTLGVLPLRGTAPQLASANFAQAAFAGVISQATRVASAATTAAGQFSDTSSPNLVPESEFNNANPSDTAKTSGYYQLQLLKRWLESWMAFSKTAAGREYFLALAVWKQSQVYLVRPRAFTADQDAGSPLEYRYSFSVEAWRSVNIKANPATISGIQPGLRDPNAMAQCLSALQDVRLALNSVRDSLSAVVGDLDNTLFEPLRESAAFMQTSLSLPFAFADLPVSILNTCKDNVLSLLVDKSRADGLSAFVQGQPPEVVNDLQLMADLGQRTSLAPTNGFEGIQEAQAGMLAPSVPAVSHEANDVFDNPGDHYSTLAALRPSDVAAPPAANKAIADEKARLSALTRLDFENRVGLIQKALEAFTSLRGLGDATYNALHGITPATSDTPPTQLDYDTSFQLNRAMLEVSRLAVVAPGPTNTTPSIGFLKALHDRSGIPFNAPQSKFLATLPHGETLEKLSERYLGDPDRIGEIIALNNLRAPYVDEEGFSLPLLTPGVDNEVVLGSSTNLVEGQAVWISSTATPTTMRRVVSMTENTPGFVTVVVDGDATMGSYSPAAGAALRAFLPGTVNSQTPLWIPSQDPPDFTETGTPGTDLVSQADLMAAVSGTDLLLTNKNDLVVTADGDWLLASGFVNVLQQARILLGLRQGTLLRHLQMGLPLDVGGSVADLDARSLLAAAQTLFDGDPAFSGVDAAAVQVQAPVAHLGLHVGIKGIPKKIPITLDVLL
jgi:hypothetical protein